MRERRGSRLPADTPVRNFLRGIPIVARRAAGGLFSPLGCGVSSAGGFITGLGMVIAASPDGPTQIIHPALEAAGLGTMAAAPLIGGVVAGTRSVARAGREALQASDRRAIASSGLVRRRLEE